MSGATPTETELAQSRFPELPHDEWIGHYARTVVGYVEAEDFRSLGGSGGIATWLLSWLLSSGEVDAVVHVHPINEPGEDGLLFSYYISTTTDEVRRGAKSRYYPIQMAQILSIIANSDIRFAVVGVPCFIKALRLLERSGHIPEGRIRHTVGLVCGHLKSRYFGEYLAWQKGIPPSEVAEIDFRWKLPNRSASNYGFAVRRQGRDEIEAYPMTSVRGRDWGEGLFKNVACEFCDDVLAECADIAVGDAWLPGYVEDPLGTSIAVIRSRALQQIFESAERDGILNLTDVGADVIAQSQAAGLRHRRRGLKHRLARRKSLGQWAPRKRVAPMLETSFSRRRVYDTRLKIAELSSSAFAAAKKSGRLDGFEATMAPLLAEYQAALQGSMLRRIARRIRSHVLALFRK